MEDLLERYREMHRRVGREFRRNQKLHRGRIHCKPGCTDCCHHIFPISEIEALDISRFVRQQPAPRKRLLEDRARVYRPQREQIMQRHGYIDARGNLPAPATRLACPALLDGMCAIYEHRPLICRKYGMPLFDPRWPNRIFACELNFEPGEQIHDPQLVQIHTGLSESGSDLQRDYSRAGGRRHDLPISVADAILEDFEDFSPK